MKNEFFYFLPLRKVPGFGVPHSIFLKRGIDVELPKYLTL